MDRFSWCDGCLFPDETLVKKQGGVAVYDGLNKGSAALPTTKKSGMPFKVKTAFNAGFLMLTTHRILWQDRQNRNCVIGLPIAVVSSYDEQPSGFTKSAKIVLNLLSATPGQPPGPATTSTFSYIRLSFREYGQQEFLSCLREVFEKKKWQESTYTPPGAPSSRPQDSSQPRQRPGIVGIERSLQQKNKETNKNISQAFQDLRNLMEKAKEMVSLSKSIASKIKDKQGEITEDETLKFKSYLLSMGIPNPVTRETHGTGDKYFTELARQLSHLLAKPVEESGGMMTLTDVYCRVNRSRGMELLSPEDLLHACELMEILRLPVRLRQFDSGVSVIQSESQDEENIITNTSSLVEESGSLTAEQLAQALGLSVILARERLLLTEKMGGVCRDETVEGLRFFPNLLLTSGS